MNRISPAKSLLEAQKKGDVLPFTSCDIITRTDVDKEERKKLMSVNIVVFQTRVATIHLYLFTGQSAKKTKSYDKKNTLV